MTLDDFSNGFDTLLGSYTVDNPLVFDEYVKSLFLTKAQKEIVESFYTGRTSDGESFESTEEMRRTLANLVAEEELKPIDGYTDGFIGVHEHSEFFELPNDLWFITYEAANVMSSRCKKIIQQDIIPVTQDDYHKTKRNPFRGLNSRRALRLDMSDNVVEIVSEEHIDSYYIRYMKKLRPIILIDLPDGLTIEGRSQASSCELHETIHSKILDRAVAMAVQSRGWTNNTKQENSDSNA